MSENGSTIIDDVVATVGGAPITASIATSYDGYYSFDDADLVLLSSDGILFGVHSSIMKMSSTFVRDMFEMKRDSAEACTSPIPVADPAEVWRMVLDIIYPHIGPKCRPSLESALEMSLELIRGAALVADKYHIQTVTVFLQDSLRYRAKNVFERQGNGEDTLNAYSLAWNLEWKEVARDISEYTTFLDYHSRGVIKCLNSMDLLASSKLRQLMERRRNGLRNCLCDLFWLSKHKRMQGNGTPAFEWNNSNAIKIWMLSKTTSCRTLVGNMTSAQSHSFGLHGSVWGSEYKAPYAFLFLVGSSGVLSEKIVDDDSLQGIWNQRCVMECGAVVDKDMFATQVLRPAILSLPKTIDLSNNDVFD